jgi:hypothetical protein
MSPNVLPEGICGAANVCAALPSQKTELPNRQKKPIKMRRPTRIIVSTCSFQKRINGNQWKKLPVSGLKRLSPPPSCNQLIGQSATVSDSIQSNLYRQLNLIHHPSRT